MCEADFSIHIKDKRHNRQMNVGVIRVLKKMVVNML